MKLASDWFWVARRDFSYRFIKIKGAVLAKRLNSRLTSTVNVSKKKSPISP